MTKISVRNLFLARDEKALHPNINIEVSAGELLLLHGPNGCGKTTLLYYLAGIFDNASVQKHSKVLFLPYEGGLYQEWTVRQNLTHFARFLDLKNEMRSAIHYFELQTLLDKPIMKLSAGQKQRVSLARIYFTRDRVLILDEPEQGLDALFLEKLRKLLRTYVALGGAAVIATHQRSGWGQAKIFDFGSSNLHKAA